MEQTMLIYLRRLFICLLTLLCLIPHSSAVADDRSSTTTPTPVQTEEEAVQTEEEAVQTEEEAVQTEEEAVQTINFVVDSGFILIKDILTKNDTLPIHTLTINDAVSKLLHVNADITNAYLEWQAGTDRYAGAFGIFEPSLVGNAKHETANRPTTIFGQVQNSYSCGIEGNLPSATKYEVNMSVSDLQYRFPDNTSLPYTLFNVTLTQPVLRGVWFGKPIIELKVAKVDRETALQKFRATLFAKIFELEIAYWKLCFAQEDVLHSTKSVAIAQEILEDSRLQLRAGKISPMETIEASAGLATRASELSNARKNLFSAINDIKQLFSGKNYLLDTLIYATSPLYLTAADSTYNAIPEDTIDFRVLQPDFLQKKSEIAREKLVVANQTNQCLPELNVKGSYGYLVSGRQTAIVWDNFLNNQYRLKSDMYSAQIEFKMPLGMNIRERKLLKAEKKILKSAKINARSIEVQIDNFLFASRKRLEDLRTNLENAQIIIQYRRALLESEIAKQKAGKSDFRKIFEIEEDLTKSLRWEMENLIDFRSLTTQIARLKGTLLLKRGLEILKENKPFLIEESFKVQ